MNFTTRYAPGQRFHRLTLLHTVRGTGRWSCRCDCGNLTEQYPNAMRRGDIKSCGCFNRDNAPFRKRTHGGASHNLAKKSPEYRSWRNARARCYDPKNAYFAQYGARGIAMCDQWRHDFAAFLADMGPRPNGTSLDRIDNDRGYEPGNCRWATTRVQAINKRHIVQVMFRGRLMTVKDAANEANVAYTSLLYRVKKRGEDVETALAYLRTHQRPSRWKRAYFRTT